MLKEYFLVLITSFIVFTSSIHPAIAAPGDKDAFDKRMTDFLSTSLSPKSSDVDIKLSADELIKFSSDYPNSQFANDALILPTLILFVGASSQGDKDAALVYINRVQDIANKYPAGKLNDFTCKRWRELLGMQSSGAVFIPYKYLPAYMRGSLGVDSRDFQAVIDNFEDLKENLDFKKDTSDMLAYEIYTPLLIAYRYLGETDRFDSTIKEARKKFPDNLLLMEAINRVTSESQDKQ